jgi:hypothetical protein
MTPSSASYGQVLKLAVSHPKGMPDDFLSFWSMAMSGGQMSIVAPTESLHPYGDISPHTGVPSIGRTRIMAMS